MSSLGGKNIPLPFFRKKLLSSPHPASAEGRIAIVTDVRKRDAVDVRRLSARSRADESIRADGQVVWS